ncbi:MAG: alpha/beta fold hydrolase [Kiritimatiellae bacterium]|nr:alpha/beta fold hydrolase [Kiritimatiellia bacterium]
MNFANARIASERCILYFGQRLRRSPRCARSPASSPKHRMTSTDTHCRRRSLPRWLLLYAALLAASHLVRMWHDHKPKLLPEQKQFLLSDEPHRRAPLRIAYVDLPATNPTAPVVLLLPGSPARAYDLRELAQRLHGPVRVIAPDLPGFGNSSRRVSTYSIRAQAARVDALLDHLGINRAHVLGYGLGGGVALELYKRDPSRIASEILYASVGVQEMELLGSYSLNHALYGVQVAAVWTLIHGVPHFGILDHTLLSLPYARSFFDSDQRPLREILESFAPPMLLLHGTDDSLVHISVAQEHQRVVPQSELIQLRGSHFQASEQAPAAALHVLDFVARAEVGTALTRSSAEPTRAERAALPFADVQRQPALGVSLLIVLVLIAASTLISEDLACIGAGLLVAHGLVAFPDAAIAAFAGIFGGDIMLYLAGRFLGRPLLRRAPFRWFVREQAIQDSAEWFARRGPIVILASRFVPGSRLPTYFTCGLLRQHFWKYLLFFFIAGALWSPLLVWVASALGERALEILHQYKAYTLGGLLAVALAFWLVAELLIPLSTLRGRRLLRGRWQRIRRFEYWPRWARYLPVFPYALYLGLRHRGLTVFTAANPSMTSGGFVAESKAAILDALSVNSRANIARYTSVPKGVSPEEALARTRDFFQRESLTFPAVLKPDIGERGMEVAVVRSERELLAYFAQPRPNTLLQEYIAGREYDVFYVRYPNEEHGRIFSITEKELPALTGDGKNNLERLILRDRRAVCMARHHLRQHRARLSWVPAASERVPLTEVGTHCRGALFRDGARLITPELSAAIDEIGRRHSGFYFGRFDVRAPTEEAFRAGRELRILELNGVSAESTNLYDPTYGPIRGWSILMKQWRIAFEIGALNRAAGAVPIPLRDLLERLAQQRLNARAANR